MAREFKATPAYRHSVPLLIGLGGPPGSGKTMSALRLASGIKRHRGGPIVVIDTERSRSLKYAPPEGVEANGVDHFDFLHVPFSPPFGSLDFLEAVMQQRVHRPSCIVIDSASDEHDGEGGMLDFHDAELQRLAGDDWAKRERVGQAAWIKPKANRLKMINGYFQIMTPIIFAFRAREKTKQIKDDRGKQVPTNIGWTPIAPSEVIHAMDLFALLPIKSDGVPMWKGNTAYEDFSIKLPRQFQGLFPEGKQIDEDMGYAMSVWALGDAKIEQVAAPQSAKPAATRATPAQAAEPASDAGTETDAGSRATTGDTGQKELEKVIGQDDVPAGMQSDCEICGARHGVECDPWCKSWDEWGDIPAHIVVARAANPRPTETASAQDAGTGQGSSASVTDASGASAAETSSQGALELQSDDGAEDEQRGAETTSSSQASSDASPAPGAETFPGDRAALGAQEAAGGFVAFAASVAAARDWKAILAALGALTASPEWTASSAEMKSTARRIAFGRLKELTDAGYRFDFVTDLQAWRAYIEWETDLDALHGNRAAVVAGDAWKALDRREDGTQAKIVLDRAYDARVASLKVAAEYA